MAHWNWNRTRPLDELDIHTDVDAVAVAADTIGSDDSSGHNPPREHDTTVRTDGTARRTPHDDQCSRCRHRDDLRPSAWASMQNLPASSDEATREVVCAEEVDAVDDRQVQTAKHHERRLLHNIHIRNKS